MKTALRLAAAALIAGFFGSPAPLLAQSGDQAGTFGIERGTGKVICTGDGDGRGEGHEALDESYARSAAWDRMVLGEAASPCSASAPVFEEIDDGVWQRTALFSGTDSAGRRADMRIYVLEDRFSWSFGSSREIEDDAGEPAKLSFIFGRPMFLGEFCQGDAAVALGAASFEGDPAVNRALSRRRAATLGQQMKRLAGFCAEQTPPELYGLTLGEFTAETPCMRDGSCTGSATSPQRRVVLLGVAEAAEGINLSEAIRSAMGSATARNVLSIEAYETFDLAAY
ncbi:MAG: hypothetical protein GVY06_06220 [Alphaproteobacteria bacterium]|nr:hypothetical protein [Alphaproteobacteria bacterium]